MKHVMGVRAAGKWSNPCALLWLVAWILAFGALGAGRALK